MKAHAGPHQACCHLVHTCCKHRPVYIGLPRTIALHYAGRQPLSVADRDAGLPHCRLGAMRFLCPQCKPVHTTCHRAFHRCYKPLGTSSWDGSRPASSPGYVAAHSDLGTLDRGTAPGLVLLLVPKGPPTPDGPFAGPLLLLRPNSDGVGAVAAS